MYLHESLSRPDVHERNEDFIAMNVLAEKLKRANMENSLAPSEDLLQFEDFLLSEIERGWKKVSRIARGSNF
jgi:hypothetical protein